jgi:hypothetical protein
LVLEIFVTENKSMKRLMEVFNYIPVTVLRCSDIIKRQRKQGKKEE